jgi:hypothetical protein
MGSSGEAGIERREMMQATLNAWDGVYLDLVALQDRIMRAAGDRKGADLYRLLGDARREAERIAPGGWSVTDLGLLPVEGSDGKDER